MIQHAETYVVACVGVFIANVSQSCYQIFHCKISCLSSRKNTKNNKYFMSSLQKNLISVMMFRLVRHAAKPLPKVRHGIHAG
jgi:hypothetical protein